MYNAIRSFKVGKSIYSSYSYPFNCYQITEKKITDKAVYSDVLGVGVILSDISVPVINVKCSSLNRIKVAYLDDDDNNISTNYNKPNQYFYNAYGVWQNGDDSYSATVFIPKDVKRVFIGLLNPSEMTISTVGSVKIDNNETPISGDSESRPKALPKGISYFDTTLNKPIYYTGSKWVDATGADV